MSRTIGTASTAPTALAGMSVKPICPRPMETVSRKPAVSPRVASRERRGKSTVAIATENTP
jgi:hypothetical protein